MLDTAGLEQKAVEQLTSALHEHTVETGEVTEMPLGERSVASLGGNTPNEKGSCKVQKIPCSLINNTARKTTVYP
jgi:hypothetical protein